VADFHALRHMFISNLARRGVHPKVAQALARHSTITLTMDRYSHTLMGEQADALAVLPDLSGPVTQEQRATGTHDAAPIRVLSSCLSSKQQFREIQAGAGRLPHGSAVESQSPVAAGFSAEKQAFGSVCTSGESPGLQNQSAPDLVPSLTPSELGSSGTTPQTGEAVLSSCLSVLRQTAPDLVLVVERWAALPEVVRAGIVALVRVAGE
jgi:hypothetical protein